MRSVGAVVLSLVLAVGPAVRADDQGDLARLAATYGRGTRVDRRAARAERPVEARLKSNAATEVVGHQIQTLLLMMIITGVEIVRANLEIAHLKKEDVNPADLARMSGEAAEQILLGGGTWASLLGMGATARLARTPLAWLKSYVASNVARPILKTLITSGIASFITFAGWEIGGQLWDEARELIEDDADYARAEHLGAALFGAALSADDRRVLGLVFTNVFRIVVSDFELRNQWLYNAWRMRIATGHFASLVGSMVGAGAVGTAIFPGAGTLAGLGFGAVGGLAALAVPERASRAMTDDFALLRVRYNATKFEQALDDLDASFEALRSGVAGVSPFFRDETRRQFAVVNAAVDDGLSARFEVIYRWHARANTLAGNRRIAVDVADQARLDKEIEKLNFKLDRGLDEAARATEDQAQRVFARYPGGPDPELETLFQKEAFELWRTAAALRLVRSGRDARAASILINKIYLLGFRASYLGN